MLNGRLAFIHANNHCFEPQKFKWSYLQMIKPADSFAVPGNSAVKASCYNEGIYQAAMLGAEWFFLMDVDMTFPPMTIPRLAETVKKYDAKIVGGLYHLKCAPWAPIAGWSKEVEPNVMKAVNVRGNLWKSEFSEVNEKTPDESVVEVDWIGSGAMLIHKSVVDAIGWPPFLDVWANGRGIRETGHDINFCARAKEKGFKVYVDTAVDCAHGDFYYFGKNFAKAAAQSNFIEHFTGVLKNQTLEKEYWDTVHGEEFIKHAARENVYAETIEDLKKIVPRGAFVADVGSGPGIFLEKLRESNEIKGSGYDFSETAVNLVNKKGFKGYLADVRTYSPNGDARSYDTVVSLHTIEHIRDDHKFIELMKSLGKPGAKIVIATAWREEIQGCFEHVHAYSDADMAALMSQHFPSFEINKNGRDYVAVGINP